MIKIHQRKLSKSINYQFSQKKNFLRYISLLILELQKVPLDGVLNKGFITGRP